MGTFQNGIGVNILSGTAGPVSPSNPLPVDAEVNSGGDLNGLVGKATNGDFVTAYTSGTTITLSSLPSPVTAITGDDIEVVRQIDTTGAWVADFIKKDNLITVAANVITVAGATFAATDTFVVYTNIPRADSGGGGSSGGGASTGSTSSVMVGSEVGTYTFDASAQTITMAGIKTLKLEEILLITNVTDQEIIYNPADASLGGTIASNVLTLEYDTTSMDDADDLQIYVQYNNSQDYSLEQDKVGVQNPEWAHYTSVEHIIDEANVAASTYRKEFTVEGYRNFVFHLNGSGGVTMTLWTTLDDTTDETADTGWVRVDPTIFPDLVDGETVFYVDTPQMPLKYMIKYVTSDATNAVDAWIRKY